jgi:hypothetical protein
MTFAETISGLHSFNQRFLDSCEGFLVHRTQSEARSKLKVLQKFRLVKKNCTLF